MQSARRHELRVLAASRPGFPVLLTLGRYARPIRYVPGLGWLTSDPATIRRVLTDPSHFLIFGQGIVGHLWAQVLGDWAYGMFDGAGHHALRCKGRGLFTEDSAAVLVARAAGPRLQRCTAELRAGGTVDIADLARALVGRIVADLVGLRVDPPAGDDDAGYRAVYDRGLELAGYAVRSTGPAPLDAGTVAAATAIVTELTGGVAAGWQGTADDTLLGRCRATGLGVRETGGLATLLTVAGTQTTASAMARTVALLHDTGEQHRLRSERHRLDEAVREGLRVASPVPVIGRSVGADIEVGGRWLRAGQRVLMLTHSADNAPGGFSLGQRRPAEHPQLSFGAGRHYCLGAPLGRLALSALLGALLATGRPWRVVERRYARRALIPAYARLRIALV